ncbi:MAG: DUF411 domain-containing protein [Burkholderiales bacterium]
MNAQRRAFSLVLLAWAGAPALVFGQTARPAITVWKSPDCSCCKDWVAHLARNGFTVKVNDTGNTSARARLGIPAALGACHTAEIAGYALEGHVPAKEIFRLLKERPMAVGLAVPGMPLGSPGMDGPDYGNQRTPYDVLLVQKNGSTRVYQSYR